MFMFKHKTPPTSYNQKTLLLYKTNHADQCNRYENHTQNRMATKSVSKNVRPLIVKSV